jgi:hypothetical protein
MSFNYFHFLWQIYVDIKCHAKANNILLFIVFVCSVGVHTSSELKEMKARMESSQLETHDLSDMDLVKDHFRHLVNFIDELPSF